MNQDQQIKENERYFSNILNKLNEGGAFGWITLGEAMVKKNGKFVCSQKAYDKLNEIVSKDFLVKNFNIKTT